MAIAKFVRKARTLLWGEVPDTPVERRLLLKIDWCILSYLCLMYFSNYLDRANLANAYVSGLKEALGLEGHDLNTVNSLFTVGYTLGMVPQNLLLHIVPPRILFPVNTVIWGALTMVTSAAKNVQHLYVIRFLQGIAESSTFVGAHYIMGSWYKEHELGKRGAIFSSSAQVATIFSGVLQASIYKNMDGLHGLAGFQWLFIMCGVITLPIALYGYVVFPDTPATTRARWLSLEERSLAISRLPPKPETKLDWTVVRRVLWNWQCWMMCSIWIVGGEMISIGSNALMALWMKAQVNTDGTKVYSIPQNNYYPSGATAIAVVALLGTAVWTDHTSKRYQVNFLIAACILISSSLLFAYDPISTGGKFFAFYLSGVSYSGQASNFAWANDLLRHDDQARSVVLGSMNMMSNAFNAWWSIVFWPANDAPRWRPGMISMLVLSPLLVLLTIGAHMLQRRDIRRAEIAGVVEIEGEEVDGSVEEEKSEHGEEKGKVVEV